MVEIEQVMAINEKEFSFELEKSCYTRKLEEVRLKSNIGVKKEQKCQ